MDQFGGGSWNMIPTISSSSNPATPPPPSSSNNNQDHLYLQQPQPPQFQQQQFHQQPQSQQFQLQQQQLQRYPISQPPQPQQTSQSLASHFHLQNLVENLADAIDNGTRDQHFDTLVTELGNHFEKCQQLLNTISGSIATKAATVEGQKHKVEEAEQMLNQRRDLVAKYRNSVEELTKSDL